VRCDNLVGAIIEVCDASHLVVREHGGTMSLREGSKRQDRLDWIGVASMRIVQAAQDARAECGFDTACVAAVQEFHLVSPGQQFPHFLPGKGILFLCLDGLQRAALLELKVIAEVELQGFEDLQAAHTEC
jgi:hypothetical protein